MGKPFRGSSAMPFLLDELDKLGIPHPEPDSLAVKIMSEHRFRCGEQFMMACKAFLFELIDMPLANHSADLRLESSDKAVMAMFPELIEFQRCDEGFQMEKDELKASNFYKVLLSRDAVQIKALGRQTPNFNEKIWTKASTPVVVAASLARAEADPALSNIYKSEWNSKENKPAHYFVEASPGDRTWGVGLGREDPKIADSRFWRGENRLGNCHNLASRLLNEKRRPKEEFIEDIKEMKKNVGKENQIHPTNGTNKSDTKDAVDKQNGEATKKQIKEEVWEGLSDGEMQENKQNKHDNLTPNIKREPSPER